MTRKEQQQAVEDAVKSDPLEALKTVARGIEVHAEHQHRETHRRVWFKAAEFVSRARLLLSGISPRRHDD